MTLRACVCCRGRLGLGILEREDPNPKLRKYFMSPTLIPFFRGRKVLQVPWCPRPLFAVAPDSDTHVLISFLSFRLVLCRWPALPTTAWRW